VSNTDPLYIGNEMAAFDRKDRAYYDKFTDEQRKSFSTYLMLKYGANVSGSADMQAYYLMSTNERVNKHFFDLGKHPKLQWLSCTTVSPGMGNQFHYWLKAKKKEGDNKSQKFLAKLYPNMKSDEIDLMAKINDKRDIADMARNLGLDDKSIKAEL
jgi:acyl-CoA synthetase (AMP-forming)/AMP-acid ligase II